jgi:hypothetical protein
MGLGLSGLGMVGLRCESVVDRRNEPRTKERMKGHWDIHRSGERDDWLSWAT